MLRTLTFILLLISCVVNAQLTTSNSLSPENLVKDVLVGEGITVSNVSFRGHAQSRGYFDGSNSNIGVSDGIILSTGNVLNEVDKGKQNGPVGPNNNSGASKNWYFNNPNYGDSDLSDLISDNTYDAAVLEFDFIPQGDTVEFQYIFASEEYPEYVNQGFNDVFAFFISGPGITGGVQNLAVVPGTSIPVTINTISPSSNSSLYLSNGDGLSGSQLTDITVTNFDGFTVPLTAVSKVIPCQTYHLKIAIADVSDGSYDSGVFLKGGSLSSNPQFISVQKSTVDVGTSNLLPEGCSDGILELTRTEDIWNSFDLNYRIYGTAQNGVDYTDLTGSVSFLPGVSDVDLNIIPVSDGVSESNETVILRFPNPYVCETDSVDFTYTISDLSLINPKADSLQSTCPGDQVTIKADFTGGYLPYQYLWDNGGTSISTSVSPDTTSVYKYIITDVCNTVDSNIFKVIVPDNDSLFLKMPNDTILKCLGMNFDIVPLISDGYTPYNTNWSTGEESEKISPQILENKTFTLEVIDACDNIQIDSVTVDLDYEDLIVNISGDTVACPNDIVNFSAFASGGIPPYTYVWENGDISPRTIFSSPTSRTINVSVRDSCGIIPTKDSINLTIQKPIAKFIVNSSELETDEIVYFIDDSEGDIESYNWDLGNGNVSTSYNPNTVYSEDSIYTVELIVTDSLGCEDSTKRDIRVVRSIYLWVPNAFTPNIYHDNINSKFFAKGTGIEKFKMFIYNRWGTEVFASLDINRGWDGNFASGKPAPTGVYVYKIFVVGISGKEVDKVGSLTLFR